MISSVGFGAQAPFASLFANNNCSGESAGSVASAFGGCSGESAGSVASSGSSSGFSAVA